MRDIQPFLGLHELFGSFYHSCMIRLGLMGCGAVATYGHIPAIQQTPGLTLKAVHDPDSARVMQTQGAFGVPEGFTDPEELLRCGVDALVITSPAPTHLENVMLAARYRKPALCEKPLAMNEVDSVRMIEAMQRAGVPLYVGFTYRFAHPAAEIKRQMNARSIGQVKSLRLIYLWDCHGKRERDAAGSPNVRREGRMAEGGPMVDCGVHQIDLARWWLKSEIVRSQAHAAWVDEYEAPDHVYLHMDHASGAHTMVEMSYSYGHTSKETRCQFVYELVGTDGIIRYDRQARIFERVDGQGTTNLGWDYEKNFPGMYAELRRALETGDSGDMPTAQEGLAATRLAEAATRNLIEARMASVK